MTKDNVKEVLASYGRTALVAVLSVYLAMGGDIDIQALLYAAIASIAGPAMRAANPHDPAFGRLEAPDHLEEH
jgi:hypothetical protein